MPPAKLRNYETDFNPCLFIPVITILLIVFLVPYPCLVLILVLTQVITIIVIIVILVLIKGLVAWWPEVRVAAFLDLHSQTL